MALMMKYEMSNFMSLGEDVRLYRQGRDLEASLSRVLEADNGQQTIEMCKRGINLGCIEHVSQS